MTENETQTSQKEPLVKRIFKSIQREPLNPEDDRGRMRVVMGNLILHIHPSKTPKASLKFNYTFGLGGLLLLLASVLAITGVMLIFVYTPSPDAAYESMIALPERGISGIQLSSDTWSASWL